MKPITMIVATDSQTSIGYKNKIQWNEPIDLKFFKHITSNSIVVMGLNTAKSIIAARGISSGDILPGRRVIVLWQTGTGKLPTTSANFQKNLNLFNTLFNTELIEDASGILRTIARANPDKYVFLAGGAGTYKAHHQECNILLWSNIKGSYDSDKDIREILDYWRLHSLVEYSHNLSDSVYLSVRRQYSADALDNDYHTKLTQAVAKATTQ